MEAAEELGLTVEAVRSRIKRGTLKKEKAPDGSVFVVVEAGQTDQARPGEDHERLVEGQGNDWADAQALMIARLENEIEFLRRQLEHKDHLLAAALERIPAIEAPTEAAPAPRHGHVTASEESGRDEVGSDAQESKERRSWLYRFFFGP